MKYMRLAFVAILMAFTLGCSQRTTPTAEYKYEVIKHSDEKDLLEKEIAKISENDTFPTLVEPLKKSMDNPDSFQLVQASYEVREKYTHKPSELHINYYCLIRISFAGRNELERLYTSYQDYALYPNGKIQVKERGNTQIIGQN